MPFAKKKNTSFVRTNSVIFPHRVGSHAFKTKPYFITRKAGNAKPVATTDYCGSLSLRLTLLLNAGCGNTVHVQLRWNFGAVRVSHFVTEPASCFYSALLWICCQSRRVGVVFFFFFFLTAISLGFILLIKFLLSFFSSSNKITSVGRDVGNSFCLTKRKHNAFILAFLIGSLDLNWIVIT